MNSFLNMPKVDAAARTDILQSISKLHAKLYKYTSVKTSAQFTISLPRALTSHIAPVLPLCLVNNYELTALKHIDKSRKELPEKENEMAMLTDAIRLREPRAENRSIALHWTMINSENGRYYDCLSSVFQKISKLGLNSSELEHFCLHKPLQIACTRVQALTFCSASDTLS
ncbi:hypothetical protein EGR_10675 [Echinococcus granulosus]|uniref:Uncharacterized protein n=1 Tax=Echinococcus granulosus TaxID=6210 RepID=W6U7W2_ECHGR|nr:hypothetical protein EGR_10675 [Echinococcus granulosus]EUB54462.1 hypothetical protein EGR_10675 [Echinococcus granulosus]